VLPQQARQQARPRFAWYTNTYLQRSEGFIYRQLCGMSHADVRVLAQWTTNLEEFPAPSIYCAENAANLLGRLKNAMIRRLCRVRNRFTLPPYVIRRFIQQIKEMSPNLVYCIFGWNASQLLEVMSADGCREVPLVLYIGGSDINGAASSGSEYVARLGQCFDRAALILCGSEFLRSRVLEAGAPASKVKLHYIGVIIPADENTAPPKHGAQFRILAVSRISPVKGIPHTIAAFASVAAEMPDAVLEIVGEGEERTACAELVKQLHVVERVRFRGSQPAAAVYAAMRNADTFVQHNVRTADGQEEGWGASSAEAAAHGLPVIATRSGGVAEVVVHGETGLLGEPGDEKAMAESMLQLYRNPDLRLRYGRAGRQRARRLFDIEIQNRRLENILFEVSGRPAPVVSETTCPATR
jgi:colanic acid/amylovoran biosynthesis glycosyltransferase